MFADYDYRADSRKRVRFHAGTTYARVLELAAREIERQGAGRILDGQADGAAGNRLIRDASHAWRRRK